MSDDGPVSESRRTEESGSTGEIEIPATEASAVTALDLVVTVVVAEPDEARAERIAGALRDTPGVEVLEVASSDEDAINAVLELAPAVTLVCTDPTEGFDGRTGCLVLADKLATTAVVASSATEDANLYAALRTGARSSVLHQADDEVLRSVVTGVRRQEANLGPGACTWLRAELAHLADDPDALVPPIPLDDTEAEVLDRRVRGDDWETIAHDNELTLHLVRAACGTALAKLHRALRADRALKLIRTA